MSIIYKYSVVQLECYPTYESQTDVVFNVVWSYRGVDENGVASSCSAKTPVTFVSGSPFTPYSDLTESQVLGWVTPTISAEQQAAMEIEISDNIQWQKNQSNEPNAPPLPWPVTLIEAE